MFRPLVAIFLLAVTTASVADVYERATEALSKEPPDFRTGIPLLLEAAQRSDRRAIYALGYLHENGVGVARDRNAALVLYREGARLGDLRSIQAMARLGEGTIANPAHIAKLNARDDAEKAKEARAKLFEQAELVSGRIIQVLPDGVLVQARNCSILTADGRVIHNTSSCADTGAPFFVETKTLGTTDGEDISTRAIPSGTYEYSSIGGIKRTVRRYVAIE